MAVRRSGTTAPGPLSQGLPAALSLVLALLAAPVEADFIDAYRAGTEAAERGDWTAVERLMEEAIAERPEPAQRLLRYLHLNPYVPHYYLGLARFEKGDCPGALEAWAESERREVVRAAEEEWRRLTEGWAECRRRLERRRRIEALAAEAQELQGEVDRLSSALDELLSDPTLAGARRQDPSFDERRAELDRLLERSRDRLRTAAEADPDDPSAPPIGRRGLVAERERLERAEAALTELRSTLSEHRAALRQRLVSERERLATLGSTAQTLLGETAQLAGEFAGVAAAREELAAQLDAARAALRGDPSLPELVRRRQRLTTAVGRMRAAAEPPPARLLAAADAYFDGDLERAVELASDADFENPKARAHAALLRAAARFTQWQVDDRGDLQLLEAALRDVRAAYAADPTLSPLPGAFSPRFLAFFEANLPAAGAVQPPDPVRSDPSG